MYFPKEIFAEKYFLDIGQGVNFQVNTLADI